MFRPVAQSALLLLFLGAVLFLSAGRLDWPMAWAYLVSYAAIGAVAFAVLDRDLILERSRPTPGAARSDVILASVAAVWLLVLPPLVAGLDVGRFHWSPPLPSTLRVAGLAFFVIANLLGLWAMRHNPFFSDFVRIQSERGHHVVSDGPYAHIRHPGYAFGTLAFLAVPVALGSLWALLPALVGTALIAIRAVREERTLLHGLPGYGDYMARVRWRLLPGVW